MRLAGGVFQEHADCIKTGLANQGRLSKQVACQPLTSGQGTGQRLALALGGLAFG